MSELGVIASKFSANRESLRRFDEALRYMKTNRDIRHTTETEGQINKLLNVLDPLTDNLNDVLSESLAITEHDVLDIMKDRHSHDWPTFKSSVQELASKLKTPKFHISDNDITLLHDVADALDAECTDLFNRLGEGR